MLTNQMLHQCVKLKPVDSMINLSKAIKHTKRKRQTMLLKLKELINRMKILESILNMVINITNQCTPILLDLKPRIQWISWQLRPS